MKSVEPKKLILDLNLDNCIIKAGETVDALKVNNETYKVFHHTGWWSVDAQYFESNVK